MCRLGEEERNPEDVHSASDAFTEWVHLDIGSAHRKQP